MKTKHLLTLLLLLSFSTFAKAQVQINYQYDQNGNRILRSQTLYTDLTPIFYLRPSFAYGNTDISAVVQLVELNNLPTTGPLTLLISKDAHINLALDPNLTSLQGKPLQNSLWSLDASKPNYYWLTTSSLVPAGGVLAVGLTGLLTPAGTSGIINLSAILRQGSGEINLINNADSETVEYKP